MMPNLIQIKIFKCFLVTCGRLNWLRHEKHNEGRVLSAAEKLSLSLSLSLSFSSNNADSNQQPDTLSC